MSFYEVHKVCAFPSPSLVIATVLLRDVFVQGLSKTEKVTEKLHGVYVRKKSINIYEM